MTTYEKQRAWIVLDHPMQLATALALASYWRRDKTIVNLIISPHPYWSRVDIELYRRQFDQIHIMERPDYTWHPIRVIRNLLQIKQLKKRIHQLNIGRNDIIIGLSIFHYLENIVLSLHPHNTKICMLDLAVFNECKRDLSSKNFFTPPEGYVAAWFIEPLSGLYRTYCKKNKESPDSYWCIRYRKSLLDIFHKAVIMDNTFNTGEHTGKNTYYMLFPYVLALQGNTPMNKDNITKKKVVLFGDFFGQGIWGLKPEKYARRLNECLAYLRKNYGDTYRLIYRPHPAETSEERKYLDLSRFEIENDGMLAELYFYKNLDQIDSVFSVASTSSRSAFYFFINSYVFFETFPFSDAARNYFKSVMGQVPDQFYIRNFQEVQPKYIKPDNIKTAINVCQNVLDMVLNKQ